MKNLCFWRQILIQILTIEPNCFLIIREMRAYNESSFRGIPSNYPLKSPSPDFKSKNAIGPTLSPQNANGRKSFNQFTPPNISRKTNQMEYSTLPNYNGLNAQIIDRIFEKTQSYSAEDNQSTNAKGQYNFQVPKQLQTSYQDKDHSLMSTGKKSIFQRTEQQSEKSSIKHSKNTHEDLSKLIEEKDIIISELKGMINLMTENGRHLKNSQRSLTEEDYDRMKTQVKILTIENQKLAQVIDRINEKNQQLMRHNQNDLNRSHISHNKRTNQEQKIQSQKQQSSKLQLQSYQQKIHQYQKQIHLLKQTLEEKQFSFQKQIDELINSHKSLALECKMYENQKERFSKENQRLINLLKLKDKEKDTGYANYSYFDKQQFELSLESANTQNIKNSQQPTKTLHQQSSNSRLSIQKIKAQYQQNLKQYKQNVYNQVYSMFDTVNSTLEEINQKINVLEERINEMQRFKGLFKQRSHSISIEENDDEIKKSAIYIEEAPSSERIDDESKRSKQVLSIVLEQSRRDYEKLEIQLSHLRKEVDFYKETLRTRSQDNFKDDSNENEEYIQSYRNKIMELEALVDELREDKETKEKQLIELEAKILKAEENIMTKHQNQSGAITKVDSLQKYDDFAACQNETSLKTQILRLGQGLQQKDLQQQTLKQAIRRMQRTEDQREKELLNQIEHFQALIKETEETFKTSKQEIQVEKQILIRQIQSLRKELVFTKIQLEQNGQRKAALQKKLAEESKAQNQSKQLLFGLEQENKQVKQQTASLCNQLNYSSEKIDLLMKEKNDISEKVSILEQQNKRLSQCEQNLIRVQKIFLTYKRSFGYEDINTLIESTFSELEGETIKLKSEKNQLLKTLELQRDQSIHLKETNINMKEQVAALEETLKLYKKELEEVKKFYESLLNQKSENDPKQGSNIKSEDKLNKTMGRRNAKNKIQQLLMEENKKISNLVDSINMLGISNSSSSPQSHD